MSLRDHYINLMTMNYGEASSDTCVMNDAGRCDMAASALSPFCHGLANTGKLDFTNTFLLNSSAK